MANKRNNSGGGDIYGDMYNDQLRKYQRMSGESGDSGPEDLRFYTEEEMDAIDRAKQDAAQQAYNDAYRENYERYRRQQSQQSRQAARGRQQRDPQMSRRQQPPQPQRPDFRAEPQYGQGYDQGYGQQGYSGGYDQGHGQQGYDQGYDRGYGQEPRRERPRQGGNRGSYDDSRRRRSSPGRFADAAEQKYGGEQLVFGSNDPEGQKIKRKKHFSFGAFMRVFFIILLIILLLMQVLIFRYISMVDSVSTGRRLVNSAELSDSKVTNILLIGSDSRKDDDAGRTDSMILMSVNSRSKEIMLTSIMRDSYVEIPEHGWGKLNSAYTFGGAELLLDTIQLNFGVRVDRYVFVSFFSFINIVDAVGGIDLDISDEEAQGMTDPMAEQNKYLKNKKGTDYLKKGGKNLHVNGNQALAYARLRYVGNADFERTQRQRLVINKIVEKAKTLNPIELDNFAKISCRELTTNMSAGEMYIFFYKLLFSMGYDRGEFRVPPEGAYSYGSHDGLSTLDLDFDGCKRALKENVYK